MANGELCKHCGWEESDHLEINLYRCDDNQRRLPGYRKSLRGCSGFVSSVKKKKMTKKDIEAEAFYFEAIEKQGEFRSAWGQYSATIRQRNFNRRIERMDRNIRLARSSDEVEKAKSEKKAFVNDCERANGIYIG
jgi:hypothetical protein